MQSHWGSRMLDRNTDWRVAAAPRRRRRRSDGSTYQRRTSLVYDIIGHRVHVATRLLKLTAAPREIHVDPVGVEPWLAETAADFQSC